MRTNSKFKVKKLSKIKPFQVSTEEKLRVFSGDSNFGLSSVSAFMASPGETVNGWWKNILNPVFYKNFWACY
jgi:hypothetical protein